MKNYNYNGLNAHDVANNIIANEEKYMNVNLDSLTFEEKCRYAREFNRIDHPLSVISPNKIKTTKHFEEITRRAEAGDSLALFTLAFIAADAQTSGNYISYLEKAMDAGSYMARIEHISFALISTEENDLTEAQATLDELIDKLDSNSLTLDELRYAGRLFGTVTRRLPEPNERYNDACIRIHKALVMNGNFFELVSLITRTTGEEKDFWCTVYFLVDSYFYENYSISFANGLGEMYILGRGCDIDYEKAKKFYMDLYFRNLINRSKTLVGLGIAEDNEDLIKEAELTYKAEIENGNIDGYWKLIVLKVLEGNRKQTGEICNKAIKKHPNKLNYIFHKARHHLVEYKF